MTEHTSPLLPSSQAGKSEINKDTKMPFSTLADDPSYQRLIEEIRLASKLLAEERSIRAL